jgi:L-alanine-DL-glutamate epimerase-like enolase superfamily enzyme
MIVRMETGDGLVGWGESCSAPSYYLPELTAATLGGAIHVAPLVLGRDPRQIRRLYHEVSKALRGHGNSKTALDMALWDLAAKASGLPLVDFWGGRVAQDLPVFAVIRIGPWAEMAGLLAKLRAQGYSRFQIKLAGQSVVEDVTIIRQTLDLIEPNERVWFDPNRAWLVDDAIRVILAVKDLSPMIENPCETYDECRVVAKRTGVPFMLDEIVDSTRRFIEATVDGVMDVASLKLNTFGGLSKLRLVCDLGVELGVPMRIENYGGTGILSSAVTHLAQTLPVRYVFGLYDYVSPDLPLVSNPLEVRSGRIGVPVEAGPGLGVDVDESLLGEPVAELSSN